ncbi:MAG: 2-oxoacid:ferredoxin oxidoreductase subunit beta [Paludibacteraceae bacterium]|nr:2-oxoacid:ferredoxin oxidoreductase subunit beta [Paludibacteraceae bacterium]MBO5012670.1 2-oxoacid:ferredoxin oxidoreductase subunit beta [Paludibacteraceae bacterium]MBP3575178.1 2-oxoacid:ferredoxin oxidoreductase subunit beta [Paludibacteraceae bacterium]
MEASQFKSDQYVKFCPGCGDHAICMALQKAMAQIGIPTHQVAVISGIGCSSRMPHYLNTYGFNTIHGRGGAIATGVKTSHPELCVWQMSGDGDCMAIGGNHFIHEIRRNVDLNVCVYNNRIYGLTKGQYSPTSPKGFVSKSSPFGTVERPFIPAELVLGARGTFFARTLDVDMPTTVDCMVQAHQHKGASIIECLVNCVIFNHGTHACIADRETRADRSIVLRHGEKMIFGKEKDKGLALDYSQGIIPQIIVVPADDERVLTHDATMQDPTLHRMLAMMGQEGDTTLPIALGVIRNVEAESYDEAVNQQINEVREKSKAKTFDQLTQTLEQWEV